MPNLIDLTLNDPAACLVGFLQTNFNQNDNAGLGESVCGTFSTMFKINAQYSSLVHSGLYWR